MDRKVTVAKSAGFCFGVERAVDQVYEQIEALKNKRHPAPSTPTVPLSTTRKWSGICRIRGSWFWRQRRSYGPSRNQGTVIIRSHGVSRHVYEILKERNVAVVDATCPFVKKIHRIVASSAAGEAVVIIGSPDHPEVEGIKGWGNEHTTVIMDGEGADNYRLPEGRKLCIVSQTTFNYNKFQDLVEKFSKKGYDILVLNTICNATQERQVEARQIASQVDVMIVIGGRNSSNTQKLYEICRRECKETYYIQTLTDFKPEKAGSVRSVGITAGASTPNQIIEEVHTNVRIKF
ncbi:MAG: 4-hydroxy-3-methylbut-2-enyl diphosphate reductase [[Clostridium] symbiosum]